MVERILDDQNGPRPAILGIDCLCEVAVELRYACVLERTLRILFSRRIREHQYDFIGYLEILIVVVPIFERGDSISRKDQIPADGCLVPDANRNEVLFQNGVVTVVSYGQSQFVSGTDFAARGEHELLVIRPFVARRRDAARAELRGNVFRGLVQFGCAVASSFEIIACEVFDVAEIGVRQEWR